MIFSRIFHGSAAWLLLPAGFLCYRIVWLAVFGAPLFYDEAYYYDWSRNPAFGYYSKPPMVAWLTAGMSFLFGSAEWALRLGSVICYALAGLCIYGLTLSLYDAKTARISVCVFLTLPFVSFSSLFVTTDAPLLLFFAASLWTFSLALQSRSMRWWLLTGLFGGLGLLSKYSMGIFLPGLLLVLLQNQHPGRHFAAPGIWVGGLLAFLIFLPNLLWNFQHDFITWRHTFSMSDENQPLLSPALPKFVLGQILALGPWWAFLLFLPYIWRAPENRFCLIFAAVIFGTISLQALLGGANANWAAPGFVAATPALAAALAARPRLFQAGILLNLLFMLLLYHYTFVLGLLGIQPGPGNDPWHRVAGRAEIIREMEAKSRPFQDSPLLSDSRKLLSLARYYGSNPNREVRAWNPDGMVEHQYDLMHDAAGQTGADFLWISEAELPEEEKARFDSVRYAGLAEIKVYADLWRRIYLYEARGFRGYADLPAAPEPAAKPAR